MVAGTHTETDMAKQFGWLEITQAGKQARQRFVARVLCAPSKELKNDPHTSGL